MGDESKGFRKSEADDDAVDSGWDEEPPSAPAKAPRASVPPPNAGASAQAGARPSVPPNGPRSSVPPRPSRPSVSFATGRLSKPLIDTTSLPTRSNSAPAPLEASATASTFAVTAAAVPGESAPEAAERPSIQQALEATTPSVSGVETLRRSSAGHAPARAQRAMRPALVAGVVLAAAVLGAFAMRPEAKEPGESAVSHVQAARAPDAEQGSKLEPSPRQDRPSAVTSGLANGSSLAASPSDSGAIGGTAGSLPTRAAAATGRTRVTVRTHPPGAVIYDERRRIGKDVASVRVQRGQKRKVIALLDRHHPAHVVLDGTFETVTIELEPMDAEELARASAYDQAR